jgi:hypothetical protein
MELRSWPVTPGVMSVNRICLSLCTICLCLNSVQEPSTTLDPLKNGKLAGLRVDHRMLQILRERWPEGGRGVQEFVRVLRLHEEYPASQVAQAIEQALAFGCPHLDGVLHCLHQLPSCAEDSTSLESVTPPLLQTVGSQPIDLRQYEQLLRSSG